jgi:hypothetical protein
MCVCVREYVLFMDTFLNDTFDRVYRVYNIYRYKQIVYWYTSHK